MLKQPRVPEYRNDESVGKFLKSLVLFLKDFCFEAWQENRDIRERLKKLEGK